MNGKVGIDIIIPGPTADNYINCNNNKKIKNDLFYYWGKNDHFVQNEDCQVNCSN